MTQVFDSLGKYYDIIYSDKDYAKECAFLEKIFQKYSEFQTKSILDIGCGTGGHAILLAKSGYKVTGIDLSEEMIRLAKEKTRKNGTEIDFNVMDMRKLQLNKEFDAAVCMFAVIGYLTEDNELAEALKRIRKHLKQKSLFIFDFWYAPAVLTILPESRMKTVEKEGVKVVRFAEPHLYAARYLCDVDYYFLVIKETLVLFEGREKHRVRFFFSDEIKCTLENCGFKLIKFCPFLELDGKPSEKTWNVAAIAQAV